MPVWQSIILGILQGLAEFLPISSSGHLVLFQNIFGIDGGELVFDTLLHVGTLIAVFIVLWKDIVDILKKPFQKVTLMLIIATIPAVLAALFLEDFIGEAFTGTYLGWGFIVTAIVLASLSLVKSKEEDTHSLNTIDTKQAGIMGVFQAIAILPGISRSGFTISGGLFSGVTREKAARFSFLMSIPAILGSLVFNIKDIIEIDSAVSGFSLGTAAVGMVAAALAGIVALKWMFSIIKKGKLWAFSIYVGALGILVVLDQYIFHVVF
jgi:undecaprenyl-diphosphatase